MALNDADNGIYLPRFKSTVVESLPDAHKHSGLHAGFYHVEVFARLRPVPAALINGQQGRLSLKAIKQELISGVFPCRKELKA